MSGRKRNTTIKKLVKKEEKPLEVFSTEEPAHVKILKKYYHHYDLFIKTGELVNFNHDIQDELLQVLRIKHQGYEYNRRCDACVCEFLVLTYREFKAELGI